MPSPLQVINNASPQARRKLAQAVQVYSPGRSLPPQLTGQALPSTAPSADQVAAVRRQTVALQPTAGTQGVDWVALSQAYQNTPEAQQKATEPARKAAQQKAQDDQPWYKKGLGYAINNPVAQAVLTPLSVLSVPLKTIEAGKEELAKHGPDWLTKWLQHPFDLGGGGLDQAVQSALSVVPASPFGVDVAKAKADKRSFGERIAPRSSFGSGQILTSTGNKWGDRLQGLTSDITNDPLTWLAPESEITKTTEAGAEGVEKAATIVSKAPHSKAERIALIGEWSTEQPEKVAAHSQELNKAVVRGFGSMSQEAKDAFGISKNGLRIRGFNVHVPGSTTAGNVVQALTGARREATQSLLDKLPQKVAEVRIPNEVADAYRTLRRSSSTSEETLRAGTAVAIDDARRAGEGAMTARGKNVLKQTFKDSFKGMSPTERVALGDAAERTATPNKVNEMFKSVINVYEAVTGRKVPDEHMLDPNTYFPHIMSREFRRYVRENPDNPAVRDFIKATKLVSDDTLERSGFLSKARRLVPNKPGEPPAVYTLGGRDVTITDGTVAGLNEALKTAFPEFKGQAYMTDPLMVAESYVDSLARDAGAVRGFNLTADSASPLGGRNVGDVRAAQVAMDEAYAQQSQRSRVTQAVMDNGPYVPGQEAPIIPPRPDIPTDVGGIDPSKYFQGVVHEGLGQQEAALGRGPVTDFRAAMQADLKAGARQARADMADMRKDITSDLRKAAKADDPAIKSVTAAIAGYRQELKDLGPLNQANATQIERTMEIVDKNITDLEAFQRQRAGTYKGKLTKANKAVDSAIDAHLRGLQQVRADAEAALEKGPARLRQEILERTKALNQPVVDAKFKVLAANQSGDRVALAAAERELEAAQNLRRMRMEAIIVDPLTGKRLPLSQRDIQGFDRPVGRGREAIPVTDPPQKRAFVDIIPPEAGSVETLGRGATRVPPQRTEELALQQLRSQATEGTAMEQYQRAQIAKATEKEAAYTASLEPQPLGTASVEVTTGKGKKAVTANEYRQMEGPPKPGPAEQAKSIKAAEIGKQRDAELGPLAEKNATMKDLYSDLEDKQQLVKRRDNRLAVLKRMEKADPKVAKKLPDLIKTLSDLRAAADEGVGAGVLDEITAAANESLLVNHATNLERIERAYPTFSQIEKVSRDAHGGKLAKIMVATLHDGWVAMHDGIVQEGDAFMDKALHQQFTRLYELDKEPGLFGRTFNALTNLFKTYATLSPGFHVRNALSGIFMNTADGVGLRTQLEGATLWKAWRSGGEKWLTSQEPRIQNAFEAAFASGAAGRFAESGVAQRGENQLYSKLASNRATRLSVRAGEWVEGPLRLGMALDSVDRGQNQASALARISRVHFDYSQVSSLDKQAKRFVPFWTFMSRNLPLQIQEMYTNPRLYSYYNHLVENFSDTPDPLTPDYWKKLGTWQLPVKFNGMPVAVQPDLGFTRLGTDLSDLGDLLSLKNPGAALSNVNPYIAAPLDFINKRNSFQNRSYTDKDFTKVSGPVGALERIIGTPLGQTNSAGQVSDNFINFMRAINPVLDRTTRLVPSSIGNGGDKARTLESIARYMGVPVRTLSPKQQRAEALRRYLAQKDQNAVTRAMLQEQAS